MTLNIVSSFNGVSDPDAAAYIEAVEAADGQLLEFGVGKAINDFVLGCKADGIWDAIKASCILAGARTLEGSFIDLKSATKILTNNNFVDAYYNRKTGLVGDGSTTYLDSNRNNNADPQDSKHLAVFMSSSSTGNALLIDQGFATSGGSALSDSAVGSAYGGINGPAWVSLGTRPQAGTFFGISRASSTSLAFRKNGATSSVSQTSTSPASFATSIFRALPSTSYYSDARLAFYSIGESLDLAKLDSRVTDLITAFGAAIP